MSKNEDQARFASPVYQVNEGDAPLLIIHGDKDVTVCLDQSQRMAAVYRKAGLDVALQGVPCAGHGGDANSAPELRKMLATFF